MNINLNKFEVSVVAESYQLRDEAVEKEIELRIFSLNHARAMKNTDRIEREAGLIKSEFDKYGLDFDRVLNASRQ